MMNAKIPRTPFSTALSGSAKETELRLRNIFSGPKKRPPVLFLALVFAICVFCGNLVSFQTQAATSPSTSVSGEAGLGLRALMDRIKSLLPARQTNIEPGGAASSKAEQYYAAGSLPLFQIEFSRLDEEAQSQWLDRIYADGEIAYMGAAVTLLDEDCPAILHLAETIYRDGDVAFFAALAAHMSEDTLEQWLNRALEDENWTFQSMLFHMLDWEDELDEQKQEWEAAQKAEYGAVGITLEGKNYYYQGQLVNVFLDIRANKSFWTLDMNPRGTVHIKVIRDADNRITGVAYMTDEEIEALFSDMEDDPHIP